MQWDSVRGSLGNPATKLQRPTLNHLPSLTQPHGSAHTRTSARAFVHVLEPLTLLTYSHVYTVTQLKYTPSQPLSPRYTRAPSSSCVYALLHTHTHSQGLSGAVSPPQAPRAPQQALPGQAGPTAPAPFRAEALSVAPALQASLPELTHCPRQAHPCTVELDTKSPICLRLRCCGNFPASLSLDIAGVCGAEPPRAQGRGEGSANSRYGQG